VIVSLVSSQLSIVHDIPSLIFGAVPAWQFPATQVSAPSQYNPSSQLALFSSICPLQLSSIPLQISVAPG
jgi:hypothetical protein